MLKNYHSLLKLCETLWLTNLQHVDGEELASSLAVLREHDIELPQKMKQDLVQRRSNEMMQSGRYKELLEVTNPFQEAAPFDSASPKLSAMPIDMQRKVSTWSEVVFSILVVDWLLRGSEGAGELFEFCKLTLHSLSSVSAVDLEAPIAKEFGEQKVIFRAILALLTPSWSSDGQVAFFFCVLEHDSRHRKQGSVPECLWGVLGAGEMWGVVFNLR